MSEPQDSEIGGDLPPIDPELAAWLATDPSPAMPAEVWAGIEARLAAEPPLVPAGVVDLGAERERRRPRRALPWLVGAAGVALVGAVVVPSLNSSSPAPVVADGASTSEPVLAATPPAEAAPQASPPTPSVAVPRAMVATGTDYTAETTPVEVASLLASAGMQDRSAVETAMTASPTATTMPGVGLTSSPEALAKCLELLGLAPESVPLVVDAATVEGRAGSAIVTVAESDASGKPTMLHVVAVGQECSEADAASALRWDVPLAP